MDLICVECGTVFVKTGRGRPPLRCEKCKTIKEQRYGARHREMRRKLVADADADGGQVCVRCGRPIRPGEKVDLDHADDGDPDSYNGLAHARCNRRAGAVKGNRARAGKPRSEAEVKAITAKTGRPPRPGPAPTESRPGFVWDTVNKCWGPASRAWH